MKQFNGPESTATNRGIALLIAIILTAVFTSIAAAITTFVYKENVLSQTGRASSQAFFAADTALECAIFNDLDQNIFFEEIYSTRPSPTINVQCTSSGAAVDFVKVPNDQPQLFANCDQYKGSPAPFANCYTAMVPISASTQSRVTFLTYRNLNSANQYVIITSRGQTVAGRSVERALKYEYCFRPDGTACPQGATS